MRAELSILASLLIVAHFVPYISSYASYLATLFTLRISIISSLLLAVVLLALLLLLTITSFNVVKKNMKPNTWKVIQKLAYVFYAAILLHLLGYLLIPALSGSTYAILEIAIYSAVFAVYTILRLRKAAETKKEVSLVSAGD